jgi:osmoprotectant transport system ATP-binding protein
MDPRRPCLDALGALATLRSFHVVDRLDMHTRVCHRAPGYHAALMETAVVRFSHVEFRHGDAPPVLRNLCLSIPPGQLLTLVGRSGAGKSTLLKLVNRLLLPTAGTVYVEGTDTREAEPTRLRRRIGYVMQDAGLFPHMTVAQNIGIVPLLEGWVPDRIDARTRALLDLIGLPPDEFASRYPRELSGGQRQRVGIARALAVDPPILLMDEPFGALDPVTRADIRGAFGRIQREVRTTVMLVTHDIAEAFALGERVGVIDDGDLVVVDTPPRVASSSDPRIRALVDTMPLRPV